MDATTYAIDIAKSVFQVYWVEPGTGEIGRRKLSRAKLTQFLGPRAPARVAMEACGGAHQWAGVCRPGSAGGATAYPESEGARQRQQGRRG